MKKSEVIAIYGGTTKDWRRHKNANGDLGGWVHKNATVDARCYIGEKAVIKGGWFMGGTFYGGTFYGGTFEGGTFEGGWFTGGTFEGGTFYDGMFRGGTFKGGRFKGGRFKGGTFTDGTFTGGTFYDGMFRGGTFTGGTVIFGSRHSINWSSPTELAIGCHYHTIKFWQENYERIGREEGYTDEQIAEYKLYIDLMDKLPRPKEQS